MLAIAGMVGSAVASYFVVTGGRRGDATAAAPAPRPAKQSAYESVVPLTDEERRNIEVARRHAATHQDVQRARSALAARAHLTSEEDFSHVSNDPCHCGSFIETMNIAYGKKKAPRQNNTASLSQSMAVADFYHQGPDAGQTSDMWKKRP